MRRDEVVADVGAPWVCGCKLGTDFWGNAVARSRNCRRTAMGSAKHSGRLRTGSLGRMCLARRVVPLGLASISEDALGGVVAQCGWRRKRFVLRVTRRYGLGWCVEFVTLVTLYRWDL